MLTEDTLHPPKIPEPLPVAPPVELPPDSLGYRLKRKLLGPPLDTEDRRLTRTAVRTVAGGAGRRSRTSAAGAEEGALAVRR
jgi:hypothetical protein